MSTTFSVLLIDDDEYLHKIFRSILDYHDLGLFAVKDAEDALNCLERHSPDLIIVDLFLFGEDGYEIMQQIRHSDLNPGCPIVATTAYHAAHTASRALLSGFDGYLPKPVAPESLVETLKAFVGQTG
jgi:CheY-like chemotaxis protein